MENKQIKRKKFIIDFIYFVIIFGLSILFIRFALPQLWAFVIAFIVVQILHKPAEALYKKMDEDNPLLHHNTICVGMVLLFYGTIGVAVLLLAIGSVKEVSSLVEPVKNFIQNIVKSITSTFAELEEASTITILGFEINIDWFDNYDYMGFINTVSSSLISFITTLPGKLPTVASSATSIFINLIICIVSTSFGLVDYDNIVTFLSGQKILQPKIPVISSIFSSIGRVVKKYLGSYLLIMLITFAELAVGLLIILRNPIAFVLAAVIAIFDILPIIGSGLFLFPWAVISMISGEFGVGIGLLILWFILSVIRNIIEPKIVGDQVGMHPLITLLAMIIGQFIYGPLGLLLLPVAIAVCCEINASEKSNGEMETVKDGKLPIYTSISNEKLKHYNEGKIETIISKTMDTIVSFVKDIFIKFWNFCFRRKGSRTEKESAAGEGKTKSGPSKHKKSKKKSGK